MITIKSQLTLSELQIDPKLIVIPPKIRIVKKQNIGDIIAYGRYKGSKANEAYLIVEGDLNEILDFCNNTLKLKIGIEKKISLDINVGYSGQCNFELSISQVKKIAKLNLALNISCYQDDNMK